MKSEVFISAWVHEKIVLALERCPLNKAQLKMKCLLVAQEPRKASFRRGDFQ